MGIFYGVGRGKSHLPGGAARGSGFRSCRAWPHRNPGATILAERRGFPEAEPALGKLPIAPVEFRLEPHREQEYTDLTRACLFALRFGEGPGQTWEGETLGLQTNTLPEGVSAKFSPPFSAAFWT